MPRTQTVFDWESVLVKVLKISSMAKHDATLQADSAAEIDAAARPLIAAIVNRRHSKAQKPAK